MRLMADDAALPSATAWMVLSFRLMVPLTAATAARPTDTFCTASSTVAVPVTFLLS